ncbi:Maf family protein [Pseudoalteromonas fenneropenaei]|uniref:7-methyl-GTP pyrophosphatase n=1 Tax=Pseudoalteromonas fenneropenaei TaxID=1737459 RepID=A0ABV7CF19_9GAMM
MKTNLILASSSPFRQSILKKFNLKFTAFAPDIDETPLAHETAQQLVARLSEQKARTAKQLFTDGLVIGSDQVAVFGDSILGKPHTKANAITQLTQFSGHKVTFLTGLSVYDIATDMAKTVVEPFHVHFRALSSEEIERYIDVEQPLQCAGSFKSEGLGICLFEKLEGDDPNALIGLPLIQLQRLLADFGVNVLMLQHRS